MTDSLSAFAEGITDISEALDDLAKRGGGPLGGKDSGGLLGWLNQKTGGALNAITSEGGQVAGAGTGEPGDYYSSWVEQKIAEAKALGADVGFGLRPPPVPEARPKRRNDGALGEYFGEGKPLDEVVYGPHLLSARPPRRPAQPTEDVLALVAAAEVRQEAVDPAAMDLLLSRRSGSGRVDPTRGLGWSPERLAAAPYRDNPLSPWLMPRDRTLGGPSGFRSDVGGPPVGSFVEDRGAPGLADLPAATERVVATFDGLAQEATRLSVLLGAPAIGEGSPVKDRPAETWDATLPTRVRGMPPTTAELVEMQARERQKRRIAAPGGDMTLGSTGTFQETGRAAQRFLDDFDTDEVVDQLKALPSAMDAGAFAAAAQAASDAFVTTLTAGLSRAEAAARDAAARMQASLSFMATPTVTPRINAPKAKVNADVGLSMSDLGAP